MIYVLDICLAEVRRHSRRRRRRRQDGHDGGLFILALACHLAVTDAPFADAAFKRQAAMELRELAQRAGCGVTSRLHYHQAITLLCSLAQYRSRSCAMPGRESVAELCAKLEGLGLGGCFGHGLRTDVAFHVAQRTKDLRDLAFAESLPSADELATASTVFSG